MIAGPYRSRADNSEKRAANLRLLNEAAVAVHRAGHVPVIGVNMALPMIEAAGGSNAASNEIRMPVALALADRCDASAGADAEVRRFQKMGRAVYRTLSDIPLSEV